MSIDKYIKRVDVQNKLEAQNIKIQEIIEALIKKTERNEANWEKSGDGNCFFIELESGTFLIYRYNRNEGRENRRYMGIRLVSNSNVIYYENEISDNNIEFQLLDNFYEKIEDITINNFLKSILEDVTINNSLNSVTKDENEEDIDEGLDLGEEFEKRIMEDLED